MGSGTGSDFTPTAMAVMYNLKHLTCCVHCFSIDVRRDSHIMSISYMHSNFYRSSTETVGFNFIRPVKISDAITPRSPATSL